MHEAVKSNQTYFKSQHQFYFKNWLIHCYILTNVNKRTRALVRLGVAAMPAIWVRTEDGIGHAVRLWGQLWIAGITSEVTSFSTACWMVGKQGKAALSGSWVQNALTFTEYREGSQHRPGDKLRIWQSPRLELGRLRCLSLTWERPWGRTELALWECTGGEGGGGGGGGRGLIPTPCCRCWTVNASVKTDACLLLLCLQLWPLIIKENTLGPWE